MLCSYKSLAPLRGICLRFASGLKYTKSHEWVRVDGGKAKFGITDFAQGHLGDIVYVDLPEVGKKVPQKSTLCVVESVKTVSDVYSPMSCEVEEVNTALLDHPTLVNKDPTGNGWIAKLKLTNLDEFDALLDEKAYKKLCEEETH